MAHQSENASRLEIKTLELASLDDFPIPNRDHAEIWFFYLPSNRTIANSKNSGTWFDCLESFAKLLHGESVIAILTSPEDAADTYLRSIRSLHFQLWVAVKRDQPSQLTGQLPNYHAALLIFTKYKESLRHTKTRIGYTYCPTCDKTTKDYGGKKHTYHQYGTLLSDIWRDIPYPPNSKPEELAIRLADLFGIAPYQQLIQVGLQQVRELQPEEVRIPTRPSNSPVRADQSSRLIQGDAISELKKLADDSIDFAFADPPYNLSKRYDAWDDGIEMQDYLDWCDTWLDELARVIKPGGICAVLNIPFLAVHHFQRLKQHLNFQNWIAWEALSLPVRMIMPAHYAIVCFSKGRARQPASNVLTMKEWFCLRASCVRARRKMRIEDHEPVTDLWWDIHRLKHNSRRVDHPCQLPPALMNRLISLFTLEGEVVLDPFNGAGTTSLCAASLGRKYLGIELSETYHALALKRHALLADGGDPFAKKTSSVPKSKNSRVNRIGGTSYKVPKRTLQLEVKRVAARLGHLPTREELEQHGQYPIEYYDEYFISWGEVCAAARTTGMTETRMASRLGESETKQKQLPFPDDPH